MGDFKVGSTSSKRPVPEWLNSSMWKSPDRTFSTSLTDKSRKNSAVKGSNGDLASPSSDSSSPVGSKYKAQGSEARKNANNGSDTWEGASRLVYGRGTGANEGEGDTCARQSGENGPARSQDVKNTVVSEPRQAASAVAAPGIPRQDSFSASPSSFRAEDNRLALERKIARFYSELAQPKIKIAELRRLAMTGIPDEGSLRSTTWKLLLGYLGSKADDWEADLANKRAEYAQFRKELIINPTELARRKEAEATGAQTSSYFDEATTGEAGGSPEWSELRGMAITEVDHPLSQGPSSVWHQYFKDTELVEQIDRDVKRTHPDLPFFNSEDGSATETQDSMRRILFLFAKLNPGIRYVQGMNEVLAPLLYVFKMDPDPECASPAEADAFFCFSLLLGDFRDHFCQQLDNSVVGIRSTIARMVDLLRTHDPELWRHMEFVCKVNPQFYAFRWITLLLTQDFRFQEILRIWDSILANAEGPLEILLRICCAMLICVRERLLAGDFTTNLKLLQRYPRVDIEIIIQTAERLHP